MMNTVNVLVTCTKDKRYPIADECQLRNVQGSSVRDRIQDWQSRTNRHWNERVPVRDLYAGDHWVNVKSFDSAYFDIDVWVCSAGYGLIHWDDEIAPYAATFSSTHPDSVAAYLDENARSTAASQWWEATESRWKSRFRDSPRSLTDLMATYPKRSLLVVASENYMRAIVNDLRSGVSHLAEPDQLSIICSGARSIEGLDANLIPCDARMQAEVGGARRSLNTRLAAKILRESRQPPRASKLSQRYRRILNEQPPIEKFDRQPMSDEEVKSFILQQLRINPKLRHSPLLRTLRESNKACEQKRFASLFKNVVEGING